MNDPDIERALGSESPHVDAEAALARLRARILSERIIPPARVVRTRPLRRWAQAAAAAIAVVAIASGLTLSGVADSLLTIFEPKRVVGVPVTQNDISTLQSACGGLRLDECLGAYGTFEWTTPPQPKEVASLAAASAAAGFDALTPDALPSAVTGAARYAVINRSSATFTFSADATRQAATRLGRTAPPMPANIDGSKVIVTGGPAVVQVWGAPASTPTTQATPAGDLPTLVIGQAKAPVVTSERVTVDELRTYLLSQPGISPQLAAAIRAIGDPATTLPVPVPAELAISHPVQVQGVDGLFIGDNSGIASAIIWQKGGMMFEVIGQLNERQALEIANSLH